MGSLTLLPKPFKLALWSFSPLNQISFRPFRADKIPKVIFPQFFSRHASSLSLFFGLGRLNTLPTNLTDRDLDFRYGPLGLAFYSAFIMSSWVIPFLGGGSIVIMLLDIKIRILPLEILYYACKGTILILEPHNDTL